MTQVKVKVKGTDSPDKLTDTSNLFTSTISGDSEQQSAAEFNIGLKGLDQVGGQTFFGDYLKGSQTNAPFTETPPQQQQKPQSNPFEEEEDLFASQQDEQVGRQPLVSEPFQTHVAEAGPQQLQGYQQFNPFEGQSEPPATPDAKDFFQSFLLQEGRTR